MLGRSKTPLSLPAWIDDIHVGMLVCLGLSIFSVLATVVWWQATSMSDQVMAKVLPADISSHDHFVATLGSAELDGNVGFGIDPSANLHRYIEFGPPSTATLHQGTVASDGSFSFTAGGDHGSTAETTASLGAIAQSGASFHLALGDLSYGVAGAETVWCDYVKTHVGANFPFQLVSGNHEQQGGPNGYILNFSACLPNRMSGLVGTYPQRYYFDYQDLMRVIMISPDLAIDGTTYNFTSGNSHYQWLSSAIDTARSAGIPWVVVGMHKNCLTLATKTCEIGADLMNLLVDKKVDLILQGHDHVYERSKQLALSGNCPSVTSGTNTPVNLACVADDGADGQYTKGAGAVLVISGVTGQSLYDVNPADVEAGYFAAWMGSNTVPTKGLTKFTVSASQLTGQFLRSSGGSYSDSFSIVKTVPTAIPTPTPQPTQVSKSTPTPKKVIQITSTPTPTPTKESQQATSSATASVQSDDCQQLSAAQGSATTTINFTQAGTYRIWGSLRTRQSGADTVWVVVDQQCPMLLGGSGVIDSAWTWVNHLNGDPSKVAEVNVTAGQHRIKVVGNEPFVQLDNLVFALR